MNMWKELSNEDRIKQINDYNAQFKKELDKKNEKELIRITKEFIKACNKINNSYTKSK